MESNPSCTDVKHINEELPIKVDEKLKLNDKEEEYSDISLHQLNFNHVDDFMEWHADKKVSSFCHCYAFTSKQDAMTYIAKVIIPDPWYRAICGNGKQLVLFLFLLLMNLENGSGGAAVASLIVVVVEKGDFSDTLFEKGENAGDGVVICKMKGGPSSSPATMVVVEENVLVDGEVVGEMESEQPSSVVAAMVATMVVVEVEESVFSDTFLGMMKQLVK
ncbi:hypothetical protein T459_08015 [Capsicum annuum]|uniref:Uncharacterized protein n=1 Tax=Capsicum annuum TaxID=4072 RepID=A0A2G2ZV99_CAPAN|nr:putative non-specific lipid-transfer protein-like protein-like [Capsicum annuum]PHT85909.1 hypothetical protein T459_08015 [Capsicum annuum]